MLIKKMVEYPIDLPVSCTVCQPLSRKSYSLIWPMSRSTKINVLVEHIQMLLYKNMKSFVLNIRIKWNRMYWYTSYINTEKNKVLIERRTFFINKSFDRRYSVRPYNMYIYNIFWSSLLLSSSTRRRFHPQRSSGQAVVTDVVPSPLRYVSSIFIAHRVQHSHCSSIFIECC